MKHISSIRFFIFFIAISAIARLEAQNLMIIHQSNGSQFQIPLESIDSVRFVTVPPPTIQKIFQNNGNILSISVSSIDSITFSIPNTVNLPSLNTSSISTLNPTSATGGGNIVSDGGSAVTLRGVCWSVSPNPTLANNFSTDGNGIGTFTSNLSPLQPATTYYVRAYAVNSEGTSYGNQIVFTTANPTSGGALATITTNNVTYTDGLNATCGGNITADGGLAVTARGVCWAIGTTPTINSNITVNGAGGGSFSSTLSNLLPNTNYFVRAYATNDAGTAYGITYSFSTFDYPTLVTLDITNINGTSAASGGIILSSGGSNIIQKGVCWSLGANPTITDFVINSGSGNNSFTSLLSNLNPVTNYYVRAFATNGVGVSYGELLSFTTTATLPTLTTITPTSITAYTAVSGGIVSSDGGAPILQKGVCWSVNPQPTIGDNFTNEGTGMADFTSNLAGLLINTNYYLRAYSVNNIGTSYGNEISFNTALSAPGQGVTFDNYSYSSLVLGNNQEWFSENLRTNIYSNGDSITNINESNQWSNSNVGAWSHYNNDIQNEIIYGKLYNWFAVADERNLCPSGWHVPTDDEWTSLTNYLGGEAIAGGKLKSTTTGAWAFPNTSATNAIGFSALAGGGRLNPYNFQKMDSSGYWWSSSEINQLLAWRKLTYNSGSINRILEASGPSLLTENFNDGNLYQNPLWLGDTSEFIIDSFSQLQSYGDTTSQSNREIYISTISDVISNSEWEFYINPKVSTSSNNRVDVFLTSSQSNLKGENTGYFVRIGGTPDEVALFRKDGLGMETYIIQPEPPGQINSASNNPTKVKVVRDEIGNWSLFADYTGTGASYTNLGTAQDSTYTTSNYFGLLVRYSSSNRYKYFFDDLQIRDINKNNGLSVRCLKD